MSERIIKWGFIGCGEVTKYKSGPAFQKIEHSEVVAVMSRKLRQGQDLRQRERYCQMVRRRAGAD